MPDSSLLVPATALVALLGSGAAGLAFALRRPAPAPAPAASRPAAPAPVPPPRRTGELPQRQSGRLDGTGPLLPPPVRPKVHLGGSTSVMFDIESLALKALNEAGLGPHAEELGRRLKRPDLSRPEFLRIVQEYVEIT